MADNAIPKEGLAFLDAISGPESAGKYNIRYDGSAKGATIDKFDDHPRILVPGPKGKTSAAGRYMFTASTWDGVPKDLRPDFSPQSQDKAAWHVAQRDYSANSGGRDLLTDLQNKGFGQHVVNNLGKTWVGLAANPQKAAAWYNSGLSNPTSVSGQGGPQQPAEAPTPLPANTPSDGILSSALATRQPAGILGSVVNPQGPLPQDPKAALAYAGGGSMPRPPGAIPNPPVSNPGLGAGGAGPGSLPTMALNPGQNPIMPGQVPVGAPGGPNLSPQGQQGSLMPSGASTPPALAINRLAALDALKNPSRASGEVPNNLEGTGQGDASPPAYNAPPGSPAAQPFQGGLPAAASGVGGFFDRLQNSGIGDGLVRAGAALMARDNPNGAAALLGTVGKRKASHQGDIEQMQDGTYARPVTDGETGEVKMVPVATSQVPQSVLDATTSAKLLQQQRLAAIKKMETDVAAKTPPGPQTPDESGNTDHMKPGWLSPTTGQAFQTPEPVLKTMLDSEMAGNSQKDVTAGLDKDTRREYYAYKAHRGIQGVDLAQARSDQTFRMSEARRLGSIAAVNDTSSANVLAATQVVKQKLNDFREVVPDTGIVPLNRANNFISSLGGKGAAEFAGLQTAFKGLKQQYMQSINSSGHATEADIKGAEKMFDEGMTVDQMNEVLNTVEQETVRHQHLRKNVRENTSDDNRGQPPRHPELNREPTQSKKSSGGGGLFEHIMGN